MMLFPWAANIVQPYRSGGTADSLALRNRVPLAGPGIASCTGSVDGARGRAHTLVPLPNVHPS
jgi:hypothetical protein